METGIDYQRYIRAVNLNLEGFGFRTLTHGEEEVVLFHLHEVVRTYPMEDMGGLNLMETLILEAIRTALEIHPDTAPVEDGDIVGAIDALIADGNVE